MSEVNETVAAPPALDLRDYYREHVVFWLLIAGTGVASILMGETFRLMLPGVSPEILVLFRVVWYLPFVGIVLLALMLPADDPDKPRSFRRFVEDSYGFTCASLPECKPKNGSRLFISWWKPGDSGRGWLTVEDNKVIIETTDGRYLKPLEPDKASDSKEMK